VGVILTGMGYDGAKGLLKLRKSGAITFGQDEKSSVVYGMPKIAYEIGAVGHQLSLDDIPEGIVNALKVPA
jgi:two-component system chemotaxis response regulator CheB